MAYNEEEIEIKLNNIFNSIESGNSLRKSLIENKMSSKTFFDWIEKSEEKRKQYARACEERAEAIVDEMYDIADSAEADVYKDDDGNVKIDGNVVQRARLQVDLRKWHVSKLNPKKYGDKMDVTTNGESLNLSPEERYARIAYLKGKLNNEQ